MKKPQSAASNTTPVAVVNPGPLLLKAREACERLGGIHPRTLARLEARGLIRSLKLLRHRLYAAKDLEELVESLRSWKG